MFSTERGSHHWECSGKGLETEECLRSLSIVRMTEWPWLPIQALVTAVVYVYKTALTECPYRVQERLTLVEESR